MKIVEKVKCKLCGDIITLKNNDEYVKCKDGCTEIRMDYRGTEWAKPGYDWSDCETIEEQKLYEEEDYLIPNEELTALIQQCEKLVELSKNDYKEITMYKYINKDTDDFGHTFLHHIEFNFTVCENEWSKEYNEFKLDLYFKKEDLFKSDTIESYIQRCKNFLKLYNYFNDLHKKGENPPKRKELEKQFYDEFVEWEYEQKKHYDVDYYI